MTIDYAAFKGHSPAPWRLDDPVFSLKSPNGGFLVSGVVSRADAALIAAAPCLLAALEMVDAAMTAGSGNAYLESKTGKIVRDAIAQAKGE